MNLHGRIPVEPLDEDRVVSIERAVMVGYSDAMARGQRTGATGARWLLPALAGAAVVAVLVAIVAWKLPPPGAMVSPPLAVPTVAPPVRIEATPAGSHVDLGDAAIDVAPGAAMVVTRPGENVLITLDRGLIELSVESRRGLGPLYVRAGDVDVIVVGTRFSVERAADVTVEVTEGVVRVKRGGKEVRLAAGQRWSAPAQIAAGAAMPQPTAITVATAGGGGTDTNPAGTGETIKAGGIETIDHGTGPELHGHDTVVPTTEGTDRAGSGGRRHGSGAAGSNALETTTKATELRLTSVGKPFDVGGTGDEAMARYRTMMSGNGDEARRGYYGVAYLLWKANKASEALRQLDYYVSRFEKGAELDDVLWLRIKIRCNTVDSICRTYASSYVQRFPGSDRAELANRLTHEIE